MVGLTLTGGNKDYFKELRLKRQQRAQAAEAGAGSSTLAAKAVVPTAVVLGPDTSCPPVNPKKRTNDDHGKDRGRSSRRHGEHSSLGKFPKRGRGVGGSSSSDLDFFSHDLRVSEGVRVTLSPYEQDSFLSARPSQVHDAFMELYSRTLVLGKRMTFDLMKRDESAAEVESLRSQLEDSAAKLQSTFEENNNLLAKNKDLEANINRKVFVPRLRGLGGKWPIKQMMRSEGSKKAFRTWPLQTIGLRKRSTRF